MDPAELVLAYSSSTVGCSVSLGSRPSTFTQFFYREMKIFQIKQLSAKKIDNDLLGFLASKVA